MDAYWMLEYVQVFGGYIFIMFIWPTVVFWKHLRKKSKIYHFNFCITVQIVLINIVVLMMGLFRILNRKTIICLFVGVFLLSVWQRMKTVWFSAQASASTDGNVRMLLQYVRKKTSENLQELKKDICANILEYGLLFGVVIFGMLYFSYGAFQVQCYGQTDIMIHHQWVNRLVEGKIFPDGIYPEAMHCFIYCMYALFGTQIYSIMAFLQCIHIMVFFLSAYGLFREIFCWRYSPVFVLALYLTINMTVFPCEDSMYRLQATLPVEYGLYTQFLCALYLIRYLKYSGHMRWKESFSKCCWDENLFLFMMSLSASVAIHYSTTIMAFIVCVSFAVFNIKKVFRFRYFIPLTVSIVCGCVVAAMPMAGALAGGTSFGAFVDRGINSINSTNVEQKQVHKDEIVKNPLEPTDKDLDIITQLPESVQKIVKSVIKTEYFLKAIIKRGYQGMYGEERGRRIFAVTAAVIMICFIGKLSSCRNLKQICSGYPPFILTTVLAMIIYMAYESPDLGFPVLIPNNRYCSSAHMVVLAVMMMPADIIFSMAASFCKDFILQTASVVFTAGIYVFINWYGIFHGYLYYSLTRYDLAVKVTNSIIEEFPQDSYTVISPHEEACQVELYGEHEEIASFIENCDGEFYSIPTEYVFIYVEKKPIEYQQLYYFSGPFWLAKSGNSQILSSIISKEDAQGDLSGLAPESRYKEGRTILESKAYEWCLQFKERYPSVLNVYYEDDDFACCYFKQNTDIPYNLAGGAQ